MSEGLLYLDSSALVKLVLPEAETGALLEVLSDWPERISSALAGVEVLRAVRRAGAGKRVRERAERVIAGIGLVRVDGAVLSGADSVKVATRPASSHLNSEVSKPFRKPEFCRKA